MISKVRLHILSFFYLIDAFWAPNRIKLRLVFGEKNVIFFKRSEHFFKSFDFFHAIAGTFANSLDHGISPPVAVQWGNSFCCNCIREGFNNNNKMVGFIQRSSDPSQPGRALDKKNPKFQKNGMSLLSL